MDAKQIDHGRYHIHIWRFGDRYQCKVCIDYKHDDPYVGFNLSDTVEEAEAKAWDWIDNYELDEKPTAEEVIAANMKAYALVYPSRMDCLQHKFFSIGNGYHWLDGRLQSIDAELPEEVENDPFEDLRSSLDGLKQKILDLVKDDEDNEELKRVLDIFEDQNKSKTRTEYDAHRTGLIDKIPPDITPDWRAVCEEIEAQVRAQGHTQRADEIKKGLDNANT